MGLATPAVEPSVPRLEAESGVRRRENCFDFLRLFAALAVVVSHTTEHLNIPFLWHQPRGSTWFYDGVALFFILSGYLVFQSAAKCYESGRPLRQFFVNRWLRIAPAIYLYAVLVPILLLALGELHPSDLRQPGLWSWFVLCFVLLPVRNPRVFAGFGTGELNGSMWTIPVECSFYVVVPLIYVAGRRLGFRRTIACLLVVALAAHTVHWWASKSPHVPARATYYFGLTFLPHLIFFGLGVMWTRAWRLAPKHPILCLAALAGYTIVRYDAVVAREVLGPAWLPLWALPLSYVVLWIGHCGPRLLSRVTRFGDLSYGAYIWHMIVVNLFLSWSFPARFAGDGTWVVLSVMAVTLAVAWLSWTLVEQPMLARKPFSSDPRKR